MTIRYKPVLTIAECIIVLILPQAKSFETNNSATVVVALLGLYFRLFRVWSRNWASGRSCTLWTACPYGHYYATNGREGLLSAQKCFDGCGGAKGLRWLISFSKQWPAGLMRAESALTLSLMSLDLGRKLGSIYSHISIQSSAFYWNWYFSHRSLCGRAPSNLQHKLPRQCFTRKTPMPV